MDATIDKRPLDDSEQIASEKLKLEVRELRWKVKWHYRCAQITSIMVAVAAAGAFVWNLYQFNYQQAESAKLAAEAKERETQAIERELKKPLLERQLALSMELSEVAAAIATLPAGDEQRKRAENRFRQLFYGPSIFIEDTTDVKKGLIQFANCLDGFDGCHSASAQSFRLKTLSKQLTNRCRGTLGLAWQVDQKDLYQDDSQPALP
jgi:hypothetical protein